MDELLAGQPEDQWRAEVRSAARKMRDRLSFMTPEHHAVRNACVAGLASHASSAPEILDDLERNLFFLVRNAAGWVTWAFPVTSERTPHELYLSTGEKTFGACAEDAFAAAFVLGRLRQRQLSVDIRSVCGQTDRPLLFTVDSDLSWQCHTQDALPLLFVPSLDWESFRAPNIIDDY